MYYNMLKESIYLLTEYQIFIFPVPVHELEQIFTDKGVEILFSEHITRPHAVCESVTIPYCTNSCEYRHMLAHEVAHVFFHDPNYLFKKDFVTIKNENQANAFAAYFLMPIYVFEEAMNYCRNDYELAKEFGVSKCFVLFRKSLTEGLISDGYFDDYYEEEYYGRSC